MACGIDPRFAIAGAVTDPASHSHCPADARQRDLGTLSNCSSASWGSFFDTRLLHMQSPLHALRSSLQAVAFTQWLSTGRVFCANLCGEASPEAWVTTTPGEGGAAITQPGTDGLIGTPYW